MNISNIENYLIEAMQLVDAWEIPASEYPEAVQAQARIMAGLHLEPSWETPLDNPYQPLLF